MINIKGRKEVVEAVLIAGLTAVVTGVWKLIEEEIQEHRKKKHKAATPSPKKVAK